MSIRHVRRVRRAGAATLMAAALAFSATACGGDDAKDKPSSSSSGGNQGGTGQDKGDGGGVTDPNASPAIATSKGDGGVDMVIHAAKRDTGGFLTVSGEFKNTSGEIFTTPVVWSGQESDVKATGPSLAAMTLVDSNGKKRYYVLRDTDNRPLTTSNYTSGIEAGKSMTFFAQFPSPPTSATSVDLQFPGFPNTTIEIS